MFWTWQSRHIYVTCKINKTISNLQRAFIPASRYVKIIKIRQYFPELWSQMYCHVFLWITVYIRFRELLPLTEFCQVKHSLCVQVLRSRILATLLHSNRALGVSQTLRRGTRKGSTEFSLLVCATGIGRAAITLGISPHSSFRTKWPLARWFILIQTRSHS